jgi:hypothetical protein
MTAVLIRRGESGHSRRHAGRIQCDSVRGERYTDTSAEPQGLMSHQKLGERSGTPSNALEGGNSLAP